MPWKLRIHHIDVGQGDSTLIVARKGAIVRSALIDGGLEDKAEDVHTYITTKASLTKLDVMVATHYDKDHFNGLRALLNKRVNTYDEVNIFDQGEQASIYAKQQRDRTFEAYIRDGERDNPYSEYLAAIQTKNLRHRITKNVSDSDLIPNVKKAGTWKEPKWLVGKEILWTDENGNPDPTLYGAGDAPGTLGGPPAITCIAANLYALKRDGTTKKLGVSGSDSGHKNDKSLVFMIQFNNFKYYIGGDITSAQEDKGISNYLNPSNNFAGRVHAMKASHHGSHHSSSANFINKLKPSAAFISFKTTNSYGHPTQRVLDDLEQCNTLTHYYFTETSTTRTSKVVVAGSPSDESRKGNIKLSITEAQSQHNKEEVPFDVVCRRKFSHR